MPAGDSAAAGIHHPETHKERITPSVRVIPRIFGSPESLNVQAALCTDAGAAQQIRAMF
jgi:hypothetical protein